MTMNKARLTRFWMQIPILLVALALGGATANAAPDDTLDTRHQILIGLTEAAQGVVVGLVEQGEVMEGEIRPGPMMVDKGRLQITGQFDDTMGKAQVRGQLGSGDSFFDVFFEVSVMPEQTGGMMKIAVMGQSAQASGAVAFPAITNQLVDGEQVMDLNMDGTTTLNGFPPSFRDWEIVKYFNFFRGGRLITDRGVKIITHRVPGTELHVILAKYLEFSKWIRHDKIRRDIIVEKRIFPLPDPQVTLDMTTSVGGTPDTLTGTITVTP